jgi:hypothetical protein
MNIEHIDKFTALFPVSLDKYDFKLALKSTDVVYIGRKIEDERTTYITTDVGLWSFINVFTNKDKAVEYLNKGSVTNIDIDTISVYELLSTFRSWCLDEEYLFVGSTADYLPTLIQSHYGGPLYPSATLMVLAAVDCVAFANKELKCLTSSHEGAEGAIYIADSIYSLITQINQEKTYDPKSTTYLLAYIPIQTIASKYSAAICENAYYELDAFLSLTSQSLAMMSDEFINEIKQGNTNVF